MPDRDLLRRYLTLLEYELALREAEEDLIRFCEVTMPDPKRPDDVTASLYLAADHHRFMADEMMAMERGAALKLINSVPPRHGKSELCTKRFAAWLSGRHPEWDIIVATYNEKFAKDFAREVRAIMSHPRFMQVFPHHHLVVENDDVLQTHAGGKLYFLGRRSSTTGRGGHFLIVDDPTKDDKEVRYQSFRDDCWQWFTQTLLTRRHNDRAPIALTMTRWSEDDLVGRIQDPNNPAYSKRFADGFRIINLPAIALDEDPLGRKAGEPLWPQRFGLSYLEEMREANALSFSALYQGDPTPDDGVFFNLSELEAAEYTNDELPERLHIYGVADLAVSTGTQNDPSCLVPFGICQNGHAWILPQIVWRRMDARAVVEEMLEIIRSRKPIFWYGEKGQISKAIGPFLRKRMEEEEVYCPIIEDFPVQDKVQRAMSARARVGQGRIRFPKNAPWWSRAKAELLKFPNARHDDFVDCVSMIGMRLANHTGPGRTPVKERFGEGTYGHLLAQFRRDDRQREAEEARRGW